MRFLHLMAAALLGAGGARAGTQPNVVVILLDDVGIEQLAVYDDQNQYSDPNGYAYAYTPNIDALAATGLRFNQFRTMPVCSSTRASLLSGSYPFRTGAGSSVKDEHSSPAFEEFSKSPAMRFVLLSSALQKQGFDAAAIGKWHLGLESLVGGTMDTHPNDVGFPTWWGVPGNLVGPGKSAAAAMFHGYYDFWWVENLTRTRIIDVHATEHTVSRAQAWLGSAQEPYFLYLALNACHTPLSPSNWPPPLHGFGPTPPPAEHVNTSYRACLEHADAEIGRLLATLDPNTLVILAGDNGTIPAAFRVKGSETRYPVGHPSHQPGDETTPLLVKPYKSWKMKKSPYEGGIRAPLIISGPSVFAPGSTSEELVDVVDLFPTIAALTGAVVPPTAIDGQDFSKVITKPTGRSRRGFSFTEFFEPNGVGAPATREVQHRSYVRRKNQHLWKLIHIVENPTGQPPIDRYEFYHLAGPSKKTPVDPLELNDLGTSHWAFKQTRRDYLKLVGKL